MAIQSQNPATEEIIKIFEELTDSQIEAKLVLAEKAFSMWKDSTFAERKAKTLKLAEIMKNECTRLASITTLETVKLLKSSENEINKCAWGLQYYAENAEKQLAPEIVKTDASESYICFEPLGTILAVMPWNFPFWQVIRPLATNLMAGNTMILKHASNVPQVALEIEKLCLRAGFPEGAFQTLLVSSSKIENLISDSRIKGVTITGSDFAGSQVGALAGKYIKPSVLELGGSDPLIVYPDVDLATVVENATSSRTLNSGQVCNAAKRFLVHADIYDPFVSALKVKFESLKVGDPLDPTTDIGPISSMSALNELESQIETARTQGATVITGGIDKDRKGFYCKPTIITDITTEMSLYFEETFGPIASVYKFTTDEEMLKISNATQFGLGASIWTRDIEHAKSLISKIEAGTVFINKTVSSNPALPFGGIKRSGYGRELSQFGIREFVNVKSVYIL
jgi:succinate-semialdehyde dehydrogenase/glutarate-semialdehyde dehydrogenase